MAMLAESAFEDEHPHPFSNTAVTERQLARLSYARLTHNQEAYFHLSDWFRFRRIQLHWNTRIRAYFITPATVLYIERCAPFCTDETL